MTPPRIGTICYATSQGLGHLARDFVASGLVSRAMVYRHPHGDRPSHMGWFPTGTVEIVRRPFYPKYKAELKNFWRGLDWVLFFETPFDWALPNLLRGAGVKTALMTMYEWFPERPPAEFDLYLCPSLLDLDVFRLKYGSRAVLLPVPAPRVPPAGPWRRREKALRFLHNAGNIGSRNHKGTLELMRAMALVESKEIRLTIRCQDEVGFTRLIRSVPGIRQDHRVSLGYGAVDYANLFAAHDVYVAPEKYNGLSLPLQEAFAAGMAVAASDRYPANTWLPREPLIPVAGYNRGIRVADGHLAIDEAIVEPRDIARVLDGLYGQDIGEPSDRGREWAEENSWERLLPRYREVMR